MKLIRWNHNISTDHVHTFTKEYKNGDQAFIDPVLDFPIELNYSTSEWNWNYADSAGQILAFGTEYSVLGCKSKCDDLNLTFPIDWETGT